MKHEDAEEEEEEEGSRGRGVWRMVHGTGAMRNRDIGVGVGIAKLISSAMVKPWYMEGLDSRKNKNKAKGGL